MLLRKRYFQDKKDIKNRKELLYKKKRSKAIYMNFIVGSEKGKCFWMRIILYSKIRLCPKRKDYSK